MSKNITVYTTNACAYCVMVKKYLNNKGLEYNEVNLEEHPERQSEIIELSGQMAVPVTVVSNSQDDQKDITIGWNPSKLSAAIQSKIQVA